MGKSVKGGRKALCWTGAAIQHSMLPARQKQGGEKEPHQGHGFQDRHMAELFPGLWQVSRSCHQQGLAEGT